MAAPKKSKSGGKRKTVKVSQKTRRAIPSHSNQSQPSTSLQGTAQGGEYFLLAGLALTVAGLLSLPNFHLLLPPDGLLARLLVHPSLLVLGLVCLAFAFYKQPWEPSRVDMPKWQAYPLFAFFLGLCFFLRFYRPLEPSAPFWFDNQVVTGDIAGIIDSGYHPLLFPWGQREAFFPYFTAAVWEIFSKQGGVWIVRLSCTLIDLIAIWALYLLGSTVLGRRLGLLLMALWSVSLPMTIWNYFGMGQNTAALASILVLLFFFRLLQKPTLARFLYWGAALGFGGYCYVPFRPWPPAMITLVLLWVLLGSKERLKGVLPWFLAAGLWVSWIFLFFLKNSYLPESNALIVTVRQPWFLALWAALLLGAYLKTVTGPDKREILRRLTGWAAAVVVMAFCMAPLYLHPMYAQHTTASSVFTGENGAALPLSAGLRGIWHNFWFFFDMMFGQPHEDVSRYPLPGRSYFEVFPELCIMIGLAFFAAKPAWDKAAIFTMALVGMTPFLFSNHAHPGRVETDVAPLFLMGSWGLYAFWAYFSREAKKVPVRAIVLLLLMGLWGWDSHKTFTDTRTWMAFMSNDNVIGHQLDKDWRQYRVIISTHYPEFATPALTVLCDQKEAYVLEDPNPIYLEPGEKGKDIVFYMYGSARYDEALEKRIRTDFPLAQWTVIECPNPDIHRFMFRVIIPMDSLEENPGKLFYVQRVPADYWRRRFYWKDYGVARGIVWWDDRVPALKAPFPSGMNEFISGQADGTIRIPVEGDYLFSVGPGPDVIVLSVDDQKILSIRSAEGSSGAKGRIHLKAGPHQVNYVTTFRRLTNFADITVKSIEGGNQWILGESSVEPKP